MARRCGNRLNVSLFPRRAIISSEQRALSYKVNRRLNDSHSATIPVFLRFGKGDGRIMRCGF